MALDYLKATDFSILPAGRHELDGANVFALVQRYQPKPLAQAVWESHREHIDVQYIAAGVERMGYMSLAAAPVIAQPYDREKDVTFYQPGSDMLTFSAGTFAIFAPQDIHAPGLAVEGAAGQAEVLKIVIKIRIEAGA